jgi:hypothetical protein
MNSLDIGKADGQVIGFGRCSENRTEADVISAFGLRQPVRLCVDFPTHNSRPAFCRGPDVVTQTTATLHGSRLSRSRRNRLQSAASKSGGQVVELGRKIDKFVDGRSFAQLDQINTTLDHPSPTAAVSASST